MTARSPGGPARPDAPAARGPGPVADQAGPSAPPASQPQRLVEDLAPRLLDAEHRGGDDAVEVPHPAEVFQDPLELYVPVGDHVEGDEQVLQLLEHLHRLGVWVEGDPALSHLLEDLGGGRDAKLPRGLFGVTAPEPREALGGAALYALPDAPPEAPPPPPGSPLRRQTPVAFRVGREVR